MPSKKYPVIDAQSAIAKHNKNLSGFKDIEARMNQAQVNKLPVPSQGEAQPTLDDYLVSHSLPNTFAVKSALAKKVGMSGYVGKPEQDKQIMAALTANESKETETKGAEKEDKFKEREFGLKEKELGIKEKEIEAKKMPGADEIADKIINKFNSQE